MSSQSTNVTAVLFLKQHSSGIAAIGSTKTAFDVHAKNLTKENIDHSHKTMYNMVRWYRFYTVKNCITKITKYWDVIRTASKLFAKARFY